MVDELLVFYFRHLAHAIDDRCVFDILWLFSQCNVSDANAPWYRLAV